MNIKNKMDPFKPHDTLPLSELSRGIRAILQTPARSTRPELLRLMEMGLVEGNEVKVLRHGIWGGPIHIRICGTNLCLRREEAQWFWVQPVSS